MKNKKGGIKFIVTAEGLSKCSEETRKLLAQVICRVFKETGSDLDTTRVIADPITGKPRGKLKLPR
jgi:hypothetical protein